MTTTFGLFSQQKPLCIGEPYDKPKKKRNKDDELVILKSFVTSPQKKGQTVSNWGGGAMKFNRLYDGEVHVEESKRRRRQKMEAKKKQIAEKAFRPGNPSKKQSSSGDYYGSFCPKPYPSMGDGKWDKSTKPRRNREEKEDDGLPTKPIYTSPSKIGHYGAPGTLMGNNKITYKPEGSDDDVLAMRRKLRIEHQEKIGERKPFSPMVGGRDARGGPGKVYEEDEACLPRKADQNEGKTRKQIMYDDKITDKKPFVPGNPPKKGNKGYFGHHNADGSHTNFPPHMPEDMDDVRIGRAKKRFEAIPEKLRERPPLKPSSTPKTYAVHSVVKKGIYSANLHKKK